MDYETIINAERRYLSLLNLYPEHELLKYFKPEENEDGNISAVLDIKFFREFKARFKGNIPEEEEVERLGISIHGYKGFVSYKVFENYGKALEQAIRVLLSN